jgi:hypothetical protein
MPPLGCANGHDGFSDDVERRPLIYKTDNFASPFFVKRTLISHTQKGSNTERSGLMSPVVAVSLAVASRA